MNMPHPSLRFATLLFLMISLLGLSKTLHAQNASKIPENQAKAALLYNFIKHTTWPDEASKSTITIAYWGTEGLFNAAFDKITENAEVRGKLLKSHNIDAYSSAAKYDVLVIGQAFSHLLPEVSLALTGTQTLIVSDGATSQSSVMINFTYPSPSKLSFTINSSNLRYEGLQISNDILLYGGSEIEVVALYKEMEKKLLASKKQLVQSQQLLESQKKQLQQQKATIQSQGEHIARQQASIHQLNERQKEIESKLASSTEALNEGQLLIEQSQNRLAESRARAEKLALSIENNQAILQGQKQEIAQQTQKLSQQLEQINLQNQQLSQQETLITNQRGIIVAALSALLLVAIYIVFKQKRQLREEKQMTQKKSEIVEMQGKSIDLYKSSLEAKDNFLTAINHELRTPMHLILGALHNISGDDKTSLQTSLGIVEQGAEHMMTLISDILFYSELQSGQLSLRPSDIEIKKQLTETCEPYRQEAEDKGLEFYLHFSSMIPAYLNIDAERLCIVIEKVIDNAIKYTKHGQIIVNIDWKIQGGGCLVITVNDTGSGFTDEQLEKAFDPFEQNDAGLTREHGGLGIGLSMSYKLAQLMQGKINIDSNVGKGTTVNIEIPVKKADHGGNPPKNFLQLAVDNSNEQPLILIVEDNNVSQLVTKKLLANLGCTTLVANDGEKALELLKTNTPDLILMDLQMPNMDGISCTQAIKQNPSFASIPVVALTANAQDTIRKNCLNAGMAQVLTKPIDVKKLQQSLQQHTNKKLKVQDA